MMDDEDYEIENSLLNAMRDLYRLGFVTEERMEYMEDLVNPNRKASRIERAQLEAETKPTPSFNQKRARL